MERERLAVEKRRLDPQEREMMRKAEQEAEERKARRVREETDSRERNAVFAILGRLAEKLA